MLNKFATTQTFEIKRSVWLTRWLIAIHIVACFSAFLNALALQYKICIVVFIIISLWFSLKRKHEPKAVLIRYSSIAGWEITDKGGCFRSVQILPSTVITSYIIFLHTKRTGNQKRTRLIFKDALIEDDFRKLQVELLISGIDKDNLPV